MVDLAEEDEACSAIRCAFSMISSCLDLSFARMGTRSFGTGVKSLKFFENFKRSFIRIALSADARLRRLSCTFIFSILAKSRKESSSSVSTFSVAVVAVTPDPPILPGNKGCVDLVPSSLFATLWRN